MWRTWLREPPSTNRPAHHFGELPAYADDLAQRPLTFGSFNNVPKLTLLTLALWAQILKALPDSRLLLKAPSFSDGGTTSLQALWMGVPVVTQRGGNWVSGWARHVARLLA